MNCNELLKRIFDAIIALLAGLFFFPLFCIISVISFIQFRGQVFYIQERIGYKLKKFKIYKFRTMKDIKDDKGMQHKDEARLTKWGIFLRTYSLDEIPQFLNIIKGDLSLVGPRPLLEEYIPYFSNLELERHNVKPGLTGLVQVSGKNVLSWNERFSLDLLYIKNKSFLLDLDILCKTFVLLLKGQKSHFSQSLIQERGMK